MRLKQALNNGSFMAPCQAAGRGVQAPPVVSEDDRIGFGNEGLNRPGPRHVSLSAECPAGLAG